MASSAREAGENIRNLLGSLQRLETFAFPCFVGVTGSLAASVFVIGIVVGATVHRSMLAFGIGFSTLAAVMAVLGAGVWSIVTVIIPILEMSVAERDAMSMTLREYFATNNGAQKDLMESKETVIGELYIKIADRCCRLCQIFLVVCPLLFALISLTCLAFGLGDDVPVSIASLYIVLMLLASCTASVGFIIIHFPIKRNVRTMLITLIDPYLRMMLKDLEEDDVHSQELVDVPDLEVGNPVATGDAEFQEPSVSARG